MSELPGGWSVDEIAKIARITGRQPGMILDWAEARDIAAVAIVERLYAEPAPTSDDLYRAGRRAVTTADSKEKSFAGLELNVSRTGRTGVAREFARYWDGRHALVSPWEDELIDRLALWQVWEALPPRHQETLRALAEHGSHAGARAALGLTSKAWQHRLRKARIEARVFWFWPEPPAPLWGGPDNPGMNTDARHRNKGMLHISRQRWSSRRGLKETA